MVGLRPPPSGRVADGGHGELSVVTALVAGRSIRLAPVSGWTEDVPEELAGSVADMTSGEGPTAHLAAPVAAATSVASIVSVEDRGRAATRIGIELEGIYAAHQREIFSFALHSVRDQQAAEDLTQEAFIRLLGEMRERGTPDDPRAWLYRVVSNLIVSRGRRRTVAERWKAVIARRDEPERSPEATAIRRERRDGVQAALDGMGADARTALLLAANGFSGHEIAAAIGRTDAATRTLLCRSRAHLRSCLERPTEG